MMQYIMRTLLGAIVGSWATHTLDLRATTAKCITIVVDQKMVLCFHELTIVRALRLHLKGNSSCC